MLHCRHGIGLVMSSAWFPQNMMPGIHAKEFNLCLIRPNSRQAAMCLLLRNGFCLATTIQAWLVDCCRDWATEECWSSDRVTIGFLVTSLTKALLPWLLSLDGRPVLGRVLVVPNFHLRMMEATVLIGTFKTAEIFLYPSPDFFWRQSCLSGRQTIPWTSCLVCALTCTVNCGTLYRQVCAFPNHFQSTEFTTGGLQLSCRNISRMISGNRMHLN